MPSESRGSWIRRMSLIAIMALALWSRSMAQPLPKQAASRGAACAAATTCAASSQSHPSLPTVDDMVSEWMDGQRTSAAAMFDQIDWNHPRFRKDSIFLAKEADLAKLSRDELPRRVDEIWKQVSAMKELVAGYILPQGIAAVSAGNKAEARVIFDRVIACGQCLASQPGGYLVVQAFGQGLVRKALFELGKLPG